MKEPYASKADTAFFKGEPPPNARLVKGGLKSAFRSIQLITGKSPKSLAIDLGIFDVLISRPKKKPGAKGAVVYMEVVCMGVAYTVAVYKLVQHV